MTLQSNTRKNDNEWRTARKAQRYRMEWFLSFPTLNDEDFCRKLDIILSSGKLSYGSLLMFGKRESVLGALPKFWIDYMEIPGDFYATALSCVLVLPETDIGNSHLNRSESRSENRSEKRHTGKIAVRRIEQSLINLSFASTDFQR